MGSLDRVTREHLNGETGRPVLSRSDAAVTIWRTLSRVNPISLPTVAIMACVAWFAVVALRRGICVSYFYFWGCA